MNRRKSKTVFARSSLRSRVPPPVDRLLNRLGHVVSRGAILWLQAENVLRRVREI